MLEIDLRLAGASFVAVADVAGRRFLDELPTSLGLPPEAADRLRRAAKSIVHGSPERARALTEAADPRHLAIDPRRARGERHRLPTIYSARAFRPDRLGARDPVQPSEA